MQKLAVHSAFIFNNYSLATFALIQCFCVNAFFSILFYIVKIFEIITNWVLFRMGKETEEVKKQETKPTDQTRGGSAPNKKAQKKEELVLDSS